MADDGKTGRARPMGRPPSRSRASETTTGYRIFVRDLVIPCVIGVHPHERHLAQRVRVNVELTVEGAGEPAGDDIANVVSYEEIVAGIKSLAGRGRFRLVETLADEIAALCLGDARVAAARVRVEKLDVFSEAESVGVEVERRRG